MKTLVVILALLMGGCYQTQPIALSSEQGKSMANEIRYVKDDRAGLCFATITSATYVGFQVISIATIPCERMPKP